MESVATARSSISALRTVEDDEEGLFASTHEVADFVRWPVSLVDEKGPEAAPKQARSHTAKRKDRRVGLAACGADTSARSA